MKLKANTTLKYMRGSGALFVPAAVFALLYTVFTFLLPQIIGVTVDSVIGDKTPSPIALSVIEAFGGRESLRANIAFCALGVCICALLSSAFNCLSKICISAGTEGFIMRLRNALMSHIENLPFSWHNANSTGDIIQRCTQDVNTLKNFVSQQLISVVRTLLLVTVAIIFMFGMNTVMALIYSCSVPVIVGYSWFFQNKIAKEFRHCDELEGDVLTNLQENLSGIRVVKAFGREAFEKEKFDKSVEIMADSWISLGDTLAVFWFLADLSTYIQLIVIIVAGVLMCVKGTLTLGELMVFISYQQTLQQPIRGLGRAVSEMSKADVSTDRLNDILNAEAETGSDEGLTEGFGGDIVFDNVSFSYTAEPVLSSVSFTVPAGTTLGILGPTGSGKSTLAYLLNRLYEPQSGSISVGGVDIKDYNRRYLRRNIGLVLQDPFLFSKTVAENLSLTGEASPDRMRAATDIADVTGDIESFRAGFDTVVGEKGVTLSGGQKQRLCIARTLLMDCPVMIFDDSMSALDMETDAKIRDALRENTANATIIIISHRISTLRHSDNIIVLENGRITEEGTHDELASAGGTYSRVCEIQKGHLSAAFGEGGVAVE